MKIQPRLKLGFKLLMTTPLLALLSACGGGVSPSQTVDIAVTQNCPAGLGGMPSSCCDSNGVPISPAGAGCSTTTPGMGQIGASLADGALSAGSSQLSNTSARRLVGGLGAGAGGTPPTQLAALAGNLGSIDASKTGRNATGAGLSGGSAADTGAGNGGAGNGMGAGPGAGGGGLGLGDVSTAPAAQPSGTPGPYEEGATRSGGASAAYAAKSGFDYNSGLGGNAPGGTDEAFGANRKIAAMGSADPDNYLALTSIDSSLFKIVSARYQDETRKWTLAQAEALVKAVRAQAKGQGSLKGDTRSAK